MRSGAGSCCAGALAFSVDRQRLRARSHTCTGGHIPSGNYDSIAVKGYCDVLAHAVINISDNLNVAAGTVFDAQSAPSTITIGRNVTGAQGSLVGLGCQPSRIRPTQHIHALVEAHGHSVHHDPRQYCSHDANAVLLNGITVNGNVTLSGGGSEIPWSFKNNTIGRQPHGHRANDRVARRALQPYRQQRDAERTSRRATRPGKAAVYVVLNTIERNLNCQRLTPARAGGVVPGRSTSSLARRPDSVHPWSDPVRAIRLPSSHVAGCGSVVREVGEGRLHALVPTHAPSWGGASVPSWRPGPPDGWRRLTSRLP